MDEPSGTTVADGTGNGRTGTANGGLTRGIASPITSDTSSLACAFDGVDDTITSSYNPFSNAAKVTYEGWAYRTDHATNDAIFGDFGGGVLCRLTGAGTFQWFPNTSDVVIQWFTWPGDAQWVYWVLFHDPVSSSKVSKLWLNGVFQASKASVNYATGAGTLTLGGSGDPFKGRQDEFCVYSGEPSDADVLARYQSAFAIVVAGSQASESDTTTHGPPAVTVPGTLATESESSTTAGTPPPPTLSSWIGMRAVQAPTSPTVVGSMATEADTAIPLRTLLGRMAAEIDLGYVGQNLPNLDYGPNVVDWMALTFAQVPSGVAYMPPRPAPPHPDAYYMGPVDVTARPTLIHAADPTKPRNGHFVLKGWNGPIYVDGRPTAGGASISDPTKGGSLAAGGGSDSKGIGDFRICFDDVHVVNGMMQFSGGRGIDYWYSSTTFPTDEWRLQYEAACLASGVPIAWPIPDTLQYQRVRDDFFGYYMKGNGQNSGLRLQQGAGGFYCMYVGVFGSDIHNCGNDGIFLGRSGHGIRVEGTMTWSNVGDLGGGATETWFHNDDVQFTGLEFDIAFAYCMLGRVYLGIETGPVDYITFDDIWSCGSLSVAYDIYTAVYNFGTHCHIGGDRPVKVFGNGQYVHNNRLTIPTPAYGGSGWDKAETVTGSPTLARVYDQSWPAGLSPVADSFGNVGLLPGQTDLTVLRARTDNPANVWRAAHPIDTRDDYLAARWLAA